MKYVPTLYTFLYYSLYLEKEGDKEEKRERKMVCFARAKNRRNGLKIHDLLKISLFSVSLVMRTQ